MCTSLERLHRHSKWHSSQAVQWIDVKCTSLVLLVCSRDCSSIHNSKQAQQHMASAETSLYSFTIIELGVGYVSSWT